LTTRNLPFLAADRHSGVGIVVHAFEETRTLICSNTFRALHIQFNAGSISLQQRRV